MSLADELKAAKQGGAGIPEDLKTRIEQMLRKRAAFGRLEIRDNDLNHKGTPYKEPIRQWLKSEGLTVTDLILPDARHEDSYGGLIVTW